MNEFALTATHHDQGVFLVPEIPSVRNINNVFGQYLIEHTILKQMEFSRKQQKKKMKPLYDEVQRLLALEDKKRRLFVVDPELHTQMIPCAGLRLGKRVRYEYFGEKRLSEVCTSVITKLANEFDPNNVVAFANAVTKHILAARQHTDIFSVEIVACRKKSVRQKRKKGQEENEEEQEEKEEEEDAVEDDDEDD